MRLVAYLRISSDSQLDGFGLDVQERAVRAGARAHGHRIVDVQTDAGVSGGTDAADRPGLFAALLALQHPPQADGLIVARLDRLARALTGQEAALAIAWQVGGRVVTADTGEVLRDDPDDPMRTALRHVVGCSPSWTGAWSSSGSATAGPRHPVVEPPAPIVVLVPARVPGICLAGLGSQPWCCRGGDLSNGNRMGSSASG
jgi:hypothetical protein